MTSRLIALFFLSSTLCLGQSVLTTSGDADSANADDRATTSSPSDSAQATRQTGTRDNGGNADQQLSAQPSLTNQTQTQTRNQNQNRIAQPPAVKSEFEVFAEDATGRPLPVYGRKLFDRSPTTFAPVERVPVPVNYV